jgi:FixJ family two-component response regulator
MPMGAPSSIGEKTQTAGTRVLILILPEQRERIGQLFAKVSVNLEIYTTVEEFITECYDTQYSVAILPIGVISAEQRVLLTCALGSMRLCPSIIVYSPQGGSLGWPGLVDSGDIVFVPKPFSEDRLRDAVGLAAADFEERSKRRSVDGSTATKESFSEHFLSASSGQA